MTRGTRGEHGNAPIYDGPGEVHRDFIARQILRDPTAVPWRA